jgi:hypothetical protein
MPAMCVSLCPPNSTVKSADFHQTLRTDSAIHGHPDTIPFNSMWRMITTCLTCKPVRWEQCWCTYSYGLTWRRVRELGEKKSNFHQGDILVECETRWWRPCQNFCSLQFDDYNKWTNDRYYIHEVRFVSEKVHIW